MAKSGASLPKFPKAYEFEEYVAAYLQAGGQYVERNIVERDKVDILELDIVSTDYDYDPPAISLIEVKSGNWSSADVFKIRGWMEYLNIEEGAFIVQKLRPYIKKYQKRAKEIDVSLIVLEDLKNSAAKLKPLCGDTDEIDVASWRFANWTERQILRRLKELKKSNPAAERFSFLENYLYEINSATFLERNILSKLRKLFEMFTDAPHLSAKCAAEMKGGKFVFDHDVIDSSIFSDTFYRHRYNEIQISTYVEHKLRAAIIKNVVDFVLYKADETKTKKKSNILGFEVDEFDLLPKTFRNAIASIEKEKYVHRYPVFWQWFLWIFGGFILEDKIDEEFELLSKVSGIPVNQIPKAFAVYDELFPLANGWFIPADANSNIRRMHLFPSPFRGIGANYRRYRYAKKDKFEKLKLSGRYSLSDLIQWNNCVVEVLTK